MKQLHLGKTSFIISIIAVILAFVTVVDSFLTTDMMLSDNPNMEDESALNLILQFAFFIITGVIVNILIFGLPIINLLGVGLGVLSLVEKREGTLWAWFGIVINGISCLIWLAFFTLATFFLICPVDIIGAIILLPILIMIYKKRNKPKISTESNQNISN